MSDLYDSIEFDTVTYMGTSGGLGNADSDARMSYYGISGLPTCVFGGTTLLVGAGDDTANGSVYDPVVEGMLDDATAFQLTITDFVFDLMNSSVSVDIELVQDIANDGQYVLRIALLEDDCIYSSTYYDNVLRDMLPETAVTIAATGESQQVSQNFPIQGGWNLENLRLIVFVQHNGTKVVNQMCNTQPTPAYSLRYYALGTRTLITEGSHTFDQCALFNTGTETDTYTVSLDMSDLPPDWSAGFSYEGDDYSSTMITLAPGEQAQFLVTIDAASAGEGAATLVFHSQSGEANDRRLVYKVITADTQILLVDDDGAFDYETEYFAPALEATGRSFATWDRNAATVSGTTLSNFDIVVWQCGWAFPTVDAEDRAALAEYLDGGGSLFLTGQDIGWEMNSEGGDAIAWYHDYLHTNYVNDDTNDFTLEGVADDPVSDGISLTISGGDGANNQDYPSDVDPRDAYATTIFSYDASRNGATRAETETYKVVYFAFGYEAINNAADRGIVMQRIVDWLAPDVVAVPGGDAGQADLPAAATHLAGAYPNPFNPQTTIVFNLAREQEVKLAVFDLLGRHVVDLVHGRFVAGEHPVLWNGRDTAGREVSSGTYMVQMVTEDAVRSSKMMLVR